MPTIPPTVPTHHHSPLADPQVLSLPFDMVGRYRMVAEALDALRPLAGGRLRVLDVGGLVLTRRGEPVLPAGLFLPGDDVTTLDQAALELEGYVRGDGRGLAFPDDSFDVIVSCDVLEHVPAPDREAFWRELLRVARYGVALTAPFGTPEVEAAEELLFGYIRAEIGHEQIQLREHRDFGWPRLAETRALLEGWGHATREYPSGQVHAWLAMMVAKHYLFSRTDDEALHAGLDAYYTRFLSAAERREPAYRHLLLVERAGGWLAQADALLAPTVAASEAAPSPGWPDLSAWLVGALGYDAASGAPLSATTLRQQRRIADLEGAVAQRDAQVADLEARAAWLEGQSHEARRALAAVEGGRAMRLLRWLEGAIGTRRR
ncbi:MAG: hypothetical protein RLZZ387_1105 [Chloroflexota bacterium]|jgi:hypothetical protein